MEVGHNRGQVSARLRELGWAQGSIVEVSDPLAWLMKHRGTPIGADFFPYTVKSFVVASHDCDIVSRDDEPQVELLPCYDELNTTKRISFRYSLRRFALGNEALVADAARRVVLPISCLLDLSPAPWPDSDEMLEWFRLWLGRRFSRPPFPDDYVNEVVGPLQVVFKDRLSKTQRMNLSSVLREVRILLPSEDSAPYHVRILLILGSHEVNQQAGELLNMIETIINGKLTDCATISKVSVAVSELRRINAAQYFASSLLTLDGVTYKGSEVIGMSPIAL